MKKIILTLLLFCANIFSYENFDIKERENYLNNIKSNQDNILSLADFILMQKKENYFNDNTLTVKSGNILLDSFIDIYKYRNKSIDDIGFIKNYYLIGPFENSGNEGFAKQYIEQDSFDFEKKYQGKNQETYFKKVNNYEYKGYVNFKNFINPKPDSLGYMILFVDVKKSDNYQIRLGAGSYLDLFVDNQSIFYKKFKNTPYYDQNIIDVYFEKGIHKIMIKTAGEDYFGVYLRLTDKIGKKSNDLIYSFYEKEPKLAKSKVNKTNTLLIEELEKIKKESFDYYFKRAIIESYFTAYDENEKPLPYEKYFEKALTFATDNEKAYLYYHWAQNTNDEFKKREYLLKSIEFNYFDAILEEIDNNINKSYLQNVSSLIEKAEKIDEYNLKLLILKLNFYDKLNVAFYFINEIKESYKKSNINSSYFEFILNQFEFKDYISLQTKNYENFKSFPFFTNDDQEKLASYYYEANDFKNYKSYLNVLLKANPLYYSINIEWMKLLYSEKKYSEVFSFYKQNENLLKDASEALKLVAESYLQQNDIETAIYYLQQILILNPSDSKTLKFVEYLKNEKKELWGEQYEKNIIKNTKPINKEVYKNSPAYYEYEHNVIKINKDYSYDMFKSYVINVNSEEALKYYKYVSMYYNPEDEKITHSFVKIKKKDNTIVDVPNYDDKYFKSKQNGAFMNYSIREYILNNLEIGDNLVVSYYVNNRNTFHNPFFGSLFYIQTSIPKYLTTYTFITDEKLNFNLTATKTENNTNYFEFYESKGTSNESNSTGYTNNYLFLAVSTYNKWEQVINWYKNLITNTDNVPENVKKEILTLTNGKNDLEKIKIIQEYVLKNTHYVGIELGINSYKPYDTKDVLERKFGDCKDKANLFNTLMKIVNIESNMVLIRTNHLGTLKDVPANPRYFNHAISYVPSLDLFVDLTAELNGLNSLPEGDQNAFVIVVKSGQEPQLIKNILPKQIIKLNGEKSGNDLTATIEITQTNHFGASSRYSFQNKEKHKDIIETQFNSIFENFTISNIKVSDLNDIQNDFVYSFDIKITNYFKDNKTSQSIFLKDLSNKFKLLSERTTQMTSPYYEIIENIVIKNAVMKNISNTQKNLNSTKINKKYFNFEQNYNSENNTLIFNNSFKVNNKIIEINEYNEFKTELLEIENQLKNSEIYLEK